ncbi:MAG: CinA family protein [Lachnospiraceae bacterium]|nr:CinA family protein [Lachnospiraceae bacterium]
MENFLEGNIAEASISLEEEVIRLLRERGFTITTAESCTGGMISSKLVNVSGASEVINMCLVTYSNDAKHKLLGVLEETLECFGAVSAETAYEMAKGALKFASADVALSVTGLAGPGGGTQEKPVGLVYIGCNVQGKIKVEKHIFAGNRLAVRESSALAALTLAKNCILEKGLVF